MRIHSSKAWLGGWMWGALACVWVLGLGSRPFSTPDEARYVEIPREMVASGDWITPRLDGVKYFEKPPLFYWILASLQKMGAPAIHEGWMRLPNLLIAMVGLLGTWLFARRFMGDDTARKATWMLATCVIYYAHSRLIILDMTVSVCVMLAFYGFYASFHAESPEQQRWWMYATSASAACGVLTKGVVVVLLLGPVWVAWLTWERAWGRLRFVPTSILLFLAIVAPWHVWCGMKNPDFWHKYFWVEHVLRYTTTVHARYQPVWYFLPVAWVGMLPWSVLWPCRISASLSLSLRHYLVLWASWVLLFYSFSNSKLIPYILPMVPPCMLLLASGAVVRRWHGALWMLAALVSLASPAFFPELYDSKHTLLPFLYGVSAVLTMMACMVWWRPSWFVLAISSLPLLWILNKGATELQKPSIKPLVPYILELQAQTGAHIVSWRSYLQDLPVYTQQIVHVVEAMNELEYGAHAEDTSSWIFPESDLAKRTGQRYILIGRLPDVGYVPKGFSIVKQTQYFFMATHTPAISS